MTDTCVFSVIFPANLPFFEEYLSSLEEQDFNKFDIILLNDGIEETVLRKLIEKFKLKIFTYPCQGSIAAIRSYGLELLQNSNYEYIIFADTDDSFSRSRISISRKYLTDFSLVVNDLTVFYAEEGNKNIISPHYLSNRIKNNQIIDLQDLLKYNFVGLGNTAIRKEILLPVPIPEDLIAVDWYLFSYLFSIGIKGIFINSAITYYRQHTANTIGLQNISKNSLRKAFLVKKIHYSNLRQKGEFFYKEYKKILELEQCMSDDKLDEYYNQVIKGLSPFPFWWEEIKTLDEITK